MLRITLFVISFFCFPLIAQASSVTLQILGSGGPNDISGRASSGYLIWIDEESKIMIDAGSGTSLRFGEAGASMSDLAFIGISHLHTDHSIDLFSLIKRGYFSKRDTPLTIAGPSGNDHYVGFSTFVDNFLNSYDYLNYYEIDIKTIDASLPGKAQPVWSEGEIKVYSFAVEHADTPTLAYRIVTPKGDIVFMSDNNATAAGMDEFIKDANILVMHFPINEQEEESGQLFWHASPSKIGQVAQKAQPKLLVLSHFMDLSLNDKSNSLNKVQASYKGPIILANDLVKISL
jgi:ribonuclease BN (tRNA processing enzyme)|tara:strand:- start:808 stop:1674 length:867 start_codon:yes stop_codon:yes gene_type:complete